NNTFPRHALHGAQHSCSLKCDYSKRVWGKWLFGLIPVSLFVPVRKTERRGRMTEIEESNLFRTRGFGQCQIQTANQARSAPRNHHIVVAEEAACRIFEGILNNCLLLPTAQAVPQIAQVGGCIAERRLTDLCFRTGIYAGKFQVPLCSEQP